MGISIKQALISQQNGAKTHHLFQLRGGGDGTLYESISLSFNLTLAGGAIEAASSSLLVRWPYPQNSPSPQGEDGRSGPITRKVSGLSPRGIALIQHWKQCLQVTDGWKTSLNRWGMIDVRCEMWAADMAPCRINCEATKEIMLYLTIQLIGLA